MTVCPFVCLLAEFCKYYLKKSEDGKNQKMGAWIQNKNLDFPIYLLSAFAEVCTP